MAENPMQYAAVSGALTWCGKRQCRDGSSLCHCPLNAVGVHMRALHRVMHRPLQSIWLRIPAAATLPICRAPEQQCLRMALLLDNLSSVCQLI